VRDEPDDLIVLGCLFQRPNHVSQGLGAQPPQRRDGRRRRSLGEVPADVQLKQEHAVLVSHPPQQS
jgi:hypothetical protein